MRSSYKVVLIGDAKAGKSALLKRAAQRKFESGYYEETKAIVFSEIQIKNPGVSQPVKLHVWDTPGSAEYEIDLSEVYVVLVACDFSDKKNLSNIFKYLDEIIKYRNLMLGTQIILVGTKSDIENDITLEEIDEVKKLYQKYFVLDIIPTSAKTGESIDFLFNTVAERCIQLAKLQPSVFSPSKNKQEKSSSPFITFLKNHWGKILGALLVALIVMLGVWTGGTIPLIAAGVALGIGVSMAVGSGLGLTAIAAGSLAVGAAIGGLFDRLRDYIREQFEPRKELYSSKTKGNNSAYIFKGIGGYVPVPTDNSMEQNIKASNTAGSAPEIKEEKKPETLEEKFFSISLGKGSNTK